MSASHGCIDNKVVVESFKEALIGRVGADRYRMWFTHGVEFALHREADPAEQTSEETTFHASSHSGGAFHTATGTHSSREVLAEAGIAADSDSPSTSNNAWTLMVSVRGQFALDRLRKNFMRELRGAAMQACGALADVQLCLEEPAAHQVTLPLQNDGSAAEAADREADDADAEDSELVARRIDDASSQRRDSTAGHSFRSPRSDQARREQRRGQRQDGSVGRSAPRTPRRGTSVAPLSRLVDGSKQKLTRSNTPKCDSRQLDLLDHGTDPVSDPPRSRESSSQDAAGTATRVLPPTVARAAESGIRTKPSGDEATSAVTMRGTMTASNFIQGTSNQLAYTAMTMVCQNPATATPLFLCGPTGTGKTHMMSAIADQLRRRHRLRRVLHLSAEQFTNDFISSVGNSGITAFRRRYREVDALLIDDVQFLGSKKATLREMLYTVETLASSGRPLIFSGSHSPTEIQGLSRELAGRMAAGLVCNVQPLDAEVRGVMLRRWLHQRCPLEVPESLVDQINATLRGDGRVVSGVVNVMNTLQRMYGRVPTMDEMRRFAGDLLRSATPVATLSVIEQAVCEAFGLASDTLRGGSQTRAVTEPRMLAMYLSRQLTSSAYAEIARHFGGKSHSTAISAENNVKGWLAKGKSIGRGQAAMPAQAAIERVESLLRTG